MDQVLGSLNHHLASKFQTQMCMTDLDMVRAMSKIFKADLTVVCLNENGDAYDQVLDLFQDKYSQMHL